MVSLGAKDHSQAGRPPGTRVPSGRVRSRIRSRPSWPSVRTRRRRALGASALSAVVGVHVGEMRGRRISSADAPCGVAASSRIRRVSLALEITARIFRSLRIMPSSSRSRATSCSVNAAIRSGSNPSKARRKASLRARIVCQESPTWNASRLSASKSPRSSVTGTPHSVS